jgi:hypothetical protein
MRTRNLSIAASRFPVLFSPVAAQAGPGNLPSATSACLLPAEKTIGNRIKPGCAEPAMVHGFLETMRAFSGASMP